jgi:nucleotide-binding universal stress UspA family protein
MEAIDFLKREKKNAMVILGSYGRTKLSRWFKSSFVEAIVNEFSIPIFLTHH